MEIVVSRRWLDVNSTASSIVVDGQAYYFILEDRDHGLK